jgi:hypothetical protein
METQSFLKDADLDEKFDNALKRLKNLNSKIIQFEIQIIKARKSNNESLNNALENLNNALEKRKMLQIEIIQIKSAKESRDRAAKESKDQAFNKVRDWLIQF